MIDIDLSEVTEGGKISYLSGKKKGLAVRETLNLNALDAKNEIVRITMPLGVKCNESFLGGLLSRSIQHCGTRAAFLQRFVFINFSDQTLEKLSDVITATLSKGTALSSLRDDK